jgi:ribonuclease P protein subunit POP4
LGKPQASNILIHEIIGLEMEVLEDSNPFNKYFKGFVADESKNTLTLAGNKKRIIAKKDAVLLLTFDGVTVQIEGKSLLGRPEDRIKRKIKKR